MTGENHYADSHHVLYDLFRYRREKRQSVQDVAEEIGVPFDTLQKYVTGQRACPVEILKLIFLATRDILVRDLLTPEGYQLVPHRIDEDDLLESVDAEFREDMEKLAEFSKRHREAMKDGELSMPEIRELQMQFMEVIEAVERTWSKIQKEKTEK